VETSSCQIFGHSARGAPAQRVEFGKVRLTAPRRSRENPSRPKQQGGAAL